MTTSDVKGLEQLERAVQDETASLATALRQCLLLAGYAHQEELRAWALKELEGYAATDELPGYRKVHAGLEVTVDVNSSGRISRRQISPRQLSRLRVIVASRRKHRSGKESGSSKFLSEWVGQ